MTLAPPPPLTPVGWRDDHDPAVARRTPTSLADLLRVAGELAADAATAGRAAVMLGLAEPPAAPREQPPPTPPRPAAAPRPAAPGAPPPDFPAEISAPVRPAGTDPRPARRSVLTLTDPGDRTPPRPVRASVADLLAAVAPATRPEPLFDPTHQRAVLSALASTARPGTEVDIDTLLARIVSREPIGRLPWRTAPTTRLGVRLVVDHGPGMTPFRRDLRLLATALRHVIGADAVTEFAIYGDPGELVPMSGDDASQPFVRPGTCRPILLASDLGIAGASAAPRAWLRAAASATEAGCPLVVLVPYPQSRWPRWAHRRLTMVRWDRPTDAGQARRAARTAALRLGSRR